MNGGVDGGGWGDWLIEIGGWGVVFLKGIKNEREIEGLDGGMKGEGVGMVKFVGWVKGGVCSENEREISIDKKL